MGPSVTVLVQQYWNTIWTRIPCFSKYTWLTTQSKLFEQPPDVHYYIICCAHKSRSKILYGQANTTLFTFQPLVTIYSPLEYISFKQILRRGIGLHQWRIQGGANRPRPPPFFSGLFFACHPGGRSGRRMVPLPNNVNDAHKKKCVGVPPPPPPPPPHWATFFRPGAASRNLDSRPSLFTNPGSATEPYIS